MKYYHQQVPIEPFDMKQLVNVKCTCQNVPWSQREREKGRGEKVESGERKHISLPKPGKVLLRANKIGWELPTVTWILMFINSRRGKERASLKRETATLQVPYNKAANHRYDILLVQKREAKMITHANNKGRVKYNFKMESTNNKGQKILFLSIFTQQSSAQRL